MEHLVVKPVFKPVYLILLMYLCPHLSTYAQTFVNVESGAFFTDLNDIRNGNSGTLFSMKDDFQASASPYLRIRAGYLSNDFNHFSILYAPLQISETGVLERDIVFDGETFKGNIAIEAVYRFNSYRFTYNQNIISKRTFKAGLGLSAKIRDAGVSLKNRELESKSFSIGFVPLINLLAKWDVSPKISVDLFGEGLAARKGRAIDLSLSARYSITDNLQGNIGYRLLEGGADGTNRYNFIQFHFISAGLNYSFDKKRL